MTKAVKILLITLALFALIGVGYFFSIQKQDAEMDPIEIDESGRAENEDPYAGWIAYIDPDGKFAFQYPPEFGSPNDTIVTRGYDDGAGNDHSDAIFFNKFTRKGFLGELFLTTGRIWMSAGLGGFHSRLAVFNTGKPSEFGQRILDHISALSLDNICDELAKELHINESDFDKNKNIDPKLIKCSVSGDTVTFHKTAIYGSVSGLQNFYGAIRFSAASFSSVQLILITKEAPTAELLETMTQVVNSLQ